VWNAYREKIGYQDEEVRKHPNPNPVERSGLREAKDAPPGQCRSEEAAPSWFT